jgi:hypothetical protein
MMTRLQIASLRAADLAESVSAEGLAQLLESADPDRRLEGMMAAQSLAERKMLPVDWFAVSLRGMKDDPDNDCRWQAGILAGLHVSRDPQRAWQLVETLGATDDDDLRMLVAAVLLEHLIDEDEQFAARAETLSRTCAAFQQTLSMCLRARAASQEET